MKELIAKGANINHQNNVNTLYCIMCVFLFKCVSAYNYVSDMSMVVGRSGGTSISPMYDIIIYYSVSSYYIQFLAR